MKLLSLSNYTVSFGKSATYLRAAILLSVFALALLWVCALPWTFRCLVGGAVGWQLIAIFLNPSPMPQLQKLAFAANHWSLYYKQGQIQVYEKHRVLCETGIFFLLKLSHPSKQKLLVIFFDQLAENDYRMLKILEKIQ